MIRTFLAPLALSVAALPALASDYDAAMQQFLDTQIASWAHDPMIVDSVMAQNEAHADLSPAEIEEMDQAWRAEVGASATPTIDPVLTGAAADFLRGRVQDAGGAITEIFVTDMHGLNVAASHVTSDYWQGDEAKHRDTYGAGADAVHFGEIELDESSQTYQGQISMTLTDPASGEPIGALTVGVNAEALM